MGKKRKNTGFTIIIILLVIAAIGVGYYFKDSILAGTIVGVGAPSHAFVTSFSENVAAVNSQNGACQTGVENLVHNTREYTLPNNGVIRTVSVASSFDGPKSCGSGTSAQAHLSVNITCSDLNNQNIIQLDNYVLSSIVGTSGTFYQQDQFEVRRQDYPTCRKLKVDYIIESGNRGNRNGEYYTADFDVFIGESEGEVNRGTQNIVVAQSLFQAVTQFPSCSAYDFCGFETHNCAVVAVETTTGSQTQTFNNLACDAGVCIGFYDNGGRIACTSPSYNEVDPSATFYAYSGACPAQVCQAGATRCSGTGVQTCSDSNNDGCGDAWQNTQTCQSGFQCLEQNGAAQCSCNINECGSHPVGDSWCSGNTVNICEIDNQGCRRVETVACGSGFQCETHSPAQCYCTIDECEGHAVGDTWCSGNGVKTCYADAEGCLRQETSETCGGSYQCVDGACECPQTQNQCPYTGYVDCLNPGQSADYRLCVNSGDSTCPIYSLSSALYQCGAYQRCVEGTGCVADNLCSLSDPDQCSGTYVSECQYNSQSGRREFTPTFDCSTIGQTCINGACGAPASTTITSADAYALQQPITDVNVLVVQNGQPQVGVQVDIILKRGSTVVGQIRRTTDSYGRARGFTLATPTVAGAHTIEVRETQTGQGILIGSKAVSVQQSLLVSLSAQNPVFYVGTPGRVQVQVRDAQNNELINPTSMTYNIRQGSSQLPYTPVDSFGLIVEFTPVSLGDLSITATASRSGYLSGVDNDNFTVQDVTYAVSFLVDGTNIVADNQITSGQHELSYCLLRNGVPQSISSFSLHMTTPAGVDDPLNVWTHSGNCYVSTYNFEQAATTYLLSGSVTVFGQTIQPPLVQYHINTVESSSSTSGENAFYTYLVIIAGVLILLMIVFVVFALRKKKRR